jgi:putative nucleotidyltransferase with HDIG domain
VSSKNSVGFNTPFLEPLKPVVVSLIGPPNAQNLLFVDDDPLILRAFARDLHNAEIDITLARTAADGIRALGEKTFGVVLADFQMPEMDGIAFLEKVRQAAPDTARVLVSGKADVKMAIQVVNRVGLFSFVYKPWDPYELRDVIRRAMEHYAIAVENRKLGALLNAKYSELSVLTKNLEDQVENRTTSLLSGLVNALDLRDTETQSHSRRVARFSRRLAEQLGLVDDDLLSVERGALLHDVGKIGVSDAILLKPGGLSDSEWSEMKRHAEYGYHILKGIDFLGDARLLVLQHHERWDGTGYPGNLFGERIYIGARIFSIIDTYDAMTSDRPYRKALPHEDACLEIHEMSGLQFDPKIVRAWNQIAKGELLSLRNSIAAPH